MADLAQVLAGLCEEIRGLRDDLYNAAVITNGEAFAIATSGGGERLFAVAEMQPQAAALVHPAYKNDGSGPVAIHVRSEPYTSLTPPDGLTVEQTGVLLSAGGSTTSVRAPVANFSVGKGVTVILPPNETLYISVIASGAVNVIWRIIPLRGRKMIFGRGA